MPGDMPGDMPALSSHHCFSPGVGMNWTWGSFRLRRRHLPMPDVDSCTGWDAMVSWLAVCLAGLLRSVLELVIKKRWGASIGGTCEFKQVRTCDELAEHRMTVRTDWNILGLIMVNHVWLNHQNVLWKHLNGLKREKRLGLISAKKRACCGLLVNLELMIASLNHPQSKHFSVMAGSPIMGPHLCREANLTPWDARLKNEVVLHTGNEFTSAISFTSPNVT